MVWFPLLMVLVPIGPAIALFARGGVRAGGLDDAAAPETARAPETRAPETGDAAGGTEGVDVRAVALDAIARVERVAQAQQVRLQHAVASGLTVRANPRPLRVALTEILHAAIGLAPGGAVLLSARRHGGRVQITVTDDGGGTDEATLTASLRLAEQAVALQGGTLEVRSRPGFGSQVTLRLPDFAQTSRPAAPRPAATPPPEAPLPAAEPTNKTARARAD